MLHPFSPGWRDEAGVKCESAQGAWFWLSSEAQDFASPVAMAEAIFCGSEGTKSPLVLFLSWLISGLYSAGFSIWHLWHSPNINWYLLSASQALRDELFFLGRKPESGHFFCTPCRYFLPFPIANGSHHLRCDKSMLTTPSRHLSPAPIPAALHISQKSA